MLPCPFVTQNEENDVITDTNTQRSCGTSLFHLRKVAHQPIKQLNMNPSSNTYSTGDVRISNILKAVDLNTDLLNKVLVHLLKFNQRGSSISSEGTVTEKKRRASVNISPLPKKRHKLRIRNGVFTASEMQQITRGLEKLQKMPTLKYPFERKMSIVKWIDKIVWIAAQDPSKKGMMVTLINNARKKYAQLDRLILKVLLCREDPTKVALFKRSGVNFERIKREFNKLKQFDPHTSVTLDLLELQPIVNETSPSRGGSPRPGDVSSRYPVIVCTGQMKEVDENGNLGEVEGVYIRRKYVQIGDDGVFMYEPDMSRLPVKIQFMNHHGTEDAFMDICTKTLTSKVTGEVIDSFKAKRVLWCKSWTPNPGLRLRISKGEGSCEWIVVNTEYLSQSPHIVLRHADKTWKLRFDELDSLNVRQIITNNNTLG